MEPQKKPIHLNENDTPYLYEPFRNQTPAKRPHPAEKEKILKPWQSMLVFAFLMVLLISPESRWFLQAGCMEMRWTRSLYS